MKQTTSTGFSFAPALPLALLAIALTSVPVHTATAQSTWTNFSGTKVFSTIATGSASKIAGTSGGNALLYINSAWVSPNPKGYPISMNQISIGADNYVYGVRNAGDPCRYPTGADFCWSIGGILKQISTGGQWYQWGVNSANTAFQYNGNFWEQRGAVGQVSYVSSASDGTVWGITPTQAIVRWSGRSAPGVMSSTGSWVAMGGAAVQVSVGSAAEVWVVNASGNVYKWTGTTWTNRPDAGICTAVAAAADGTVLVIRKADGLVYKKV